MILLAGHYCHDTLLSNAEGGATREHRALGGSSAYASAILEAAGAPYEVIAKVGPDFLYAAQVHRPARVVAGARTTSFVDDYRGGARTSRVTARCEPIAPGDLPGRAEISIACGIAGEIGAATLQRLRAISDVVLADAQGLLRRIGPDGEVTLGPLPDGAAAQLDVLKASREEAALLDVAALRQELTLLVTDGPRGSTVLTRGEEVHLAAVPAGEVDATGAGDCFLAGVALGLHRGLSLVEAARLGNLCGALAVAQVGIPRASELRERLR